MLNTKIKAVVFIFIFFLGVNSAWASDPYYSQQWYLNNISAQQAWNITRGSDDIVVAVVDTGVDLNHPDLRDNIWNNYDEIDNNGKDDDANGYRDDKHGWDFVKNRALPEPTINSNSNKTSVSHGTFIAGMIGAVHDNGFGIKGVAGNVKVMPLVAIGTQGQGSATTVAKAINYAVNNGADIINLSFVGNNSSTSLYQSIRNAYDNGVLVVAAAGNGDNDGKGVDLAREKMYPICFDLNSNINRVMGVVATDRSDMLASFSNYGEGCADIAAPGSELTSLLFQDSSQPGYRDYLDSGWMGSSFSTGLVSGAAALMKSVNKQLSTEQIINLIKDNSDSMRVPGTEYVGKTGDGLLNIYESVKAARNVTGDLPTSPQAPTQSEPEPEPEPEREPQSSTPVVQPPRRTPVTTPSRDDEPTREKSVPKAEPTPISQHVKPKLPITGGALLYASPKTGAEALARVYNTGHKNLQEDHIFKGGGFQGLNIDIVDYNGTAMLSGATGGTMPFVRLLNSAGIIESSFLAFDDNFRGGVEVSGGDTDLDGELDLIVAPAGDYAPVVRIFDLSGKLKKEFSVFRNDYTAGLNVAVGNVMGDAKPEIVVAPHEGMMPIIKIYNENGELLKSFLAYAPNFKGGVNIDLADLDGDGYEDIVTGASRGGGPHVQAFNAQGDRLVSFMAYNGRFTIGIEVASGDWNGDGVNDIFTVAGPGGGPHIKVFDRSGNFMDEFFAWENDFTKGINISIK